MFLDGFDADAQHRSDLLVGFTLADEFQGLQFALGEFGSLDSRLFAARQRDAVLLQHALRNGRTEIAFAGVGCAHCLDDFRGGGLFHEITGGACFQCAIDLLRFAVAGEDEHFGVGNFNGQLPGGFDAMHNGHGDVEERDVRLEFLGDAHGLFAVFGFAGDLNVARGLEERFQTVAHDGVVINY